MARDPLGYRMAPISLPCGGTGIFDYSSEIGHRCDRCFAVVGSAGMPQDCARMFREHGANKKEPAHDR